MGLLDELAAASKERVNDPSANGLSSKTTTTGIEVNDALVDCVLIRSDAVGRSNEAVWLGNSTAGTGLCHCFQSCTGKGRHVLSSGSGFVIVSAHARALFVNTLQSKTSTTFDTQEMVRYSSSRPRRSANGYWDLCKK